MFDRVRRCALGELAPYFVFRGVVLQFIGNDTLPGSEFERDHV